MTFNIMNKNSSTQRRFMEGFMGKKHYLCFFLLIKRKNGYQIYIHLLMAKDRIYLWQ